MKKLIKKILRTYSNMETFDEKTFWCTAPCTAFLFLATCIINAFENMKPIQIWICAIDAAIVILLLYLGAKTKKFKFYYRIFVAVLCAVIVPVTLTINGGLLSGLPICCIIALTSCIVISDKKIRLLISFGSILITCIAMALEIINPDFIFAMSEGFDYRFDNFICYVVGAITLTIAGSLLMDEFNRYAFSKKTLNMFMDKKVQEVAFKQNESDAVKQVESVRCYATVLFADISAFSSLSQNMPPQKIADFLNVFLKTADNCVYDNEGIVDKYMGDAIMAYWIDEDQSGYGAYNACKTIIDLRKSLHFMAEQIHKDFGCDIDFSAGINYGEVIIGTLGTERHLEYTIIGDPVNVASKLQSSATKGECLVSQRIYDMVNKEIELQQTERPLFFKGNAHENTVYKLKGINNHNVTEKRSVILNDSNNGYMFTFCGCRGSYAVSGAVFTEFGGQTSCYVLKKDKYALVIDCGTGLYKARTILSDCEQIDVLLTHVHYDHILGLLDWSVFPRNAKIRFYGNFDQWEGEKTISNFLRAPFWPVDLSNAEINSIEKQHTYCLNNEINAIFYESSHPNYGCVISLDVAGTKVFIMADCEDPDTLPKDVCSNADILIFDGMYEQKDYQKHIGWGHSTWERGVRLALEEKVKLLYITHHNPANTDAMLAELEKRAQDIFPNTRFAREGDKLYI